MQVNVPRDGVPLASSSSTNILLEETYIHWQNKQKDTFRKLKTRRFVHTSTYDPVLLQAIGIAIEFDFVFRTVGWESV